MKFIYPSEMSDDEIEARQSEDKLQDLRTRLGLDGDTDLVDEIQRLQRLANGVEGSLADASTVDDDSPAIETDNATDGSDGTEMDESNVYETQY